MSRENVCTLERAIEAFDRRDIEALAPLMTPDFEWVGAFLGRVEGGSYLGRVGMERYFSDARETWDEFRSVTDGLRDLEDRVFLSGRLEGRGKGSGALVDVPFWMIADFRDGAIWRCVAYLDRDEALRAAALVS